MLPLHENIAAPGPQKATNSLRNGRFATARLSGQSKRFTPTDLEGHIPDDSGRLGAKRPDAVITIGTVQALYCQKGNRFDWRRRQHQRATSLFDCSHISPPRAGDHVVRSHWIEPLDLFKT